MINKKSRYFNTSDYKATGCLAVDMVLECAGFYRKANRPLKKIILSKFNYDKFDEYFKKNYTGGTENENGYYTIDGIEVVRAETALTEQLRVEFWPTIRNEFDDNQYLNKVNKDGE